MRFNLSVALVAALLISTPLQAAEEFFFRINMDGSLPVRVAEAPAPEVPPVSPPLARQADLVRPDNFEAPGLSGSEQLAINDGVINRLYDRGLTVSAASWPMGSPAGSQQLGLLFDTPVLADGCMVTFNAWTGEEQDYVRHINAASMEFQFRINGAWGGWTAPMGEYDPARSGNRVYDGHCGLPAGGAMVSGVRVRPTDFTGAVWYREFRLSLNGASAE